MAVKYYNEGTDLMLPDKSRMARWIRRSIENEIEGSLHLGAINFVFCSRARHLEINMQFLGHDYPTDVITFDYTDKKVVAGDIFIDPATVAENAAEHCIAFEVEMRRVMIHGVLHLCGYGDKTPKQQKQMREKEDFYLARYYGI